MDIFGHFMYSIIFSKKLTTDILIFIQNSVDKEHPCPLSPDFGLWRILVVPDWVGNHYIDLDKVTDLW